MKQTRKDKMQLIVRRLFLIATDIILINGSVLLALMMRFNNFTIESIEPKYIVHYQQFLLPFTVITLSVFWSCRIYHSLWQYASIAELYKIVEACVITELLHFSGSMFLDLELPKTCYFTSGVFLIISISASRFMYRMIRTVIQGYRQTDETVRIMIIGAGDATNVLIR